MNNLKKEAMNYDLVSLINLQNKRRDNIILFEKAIRSEREASMLEASAIATLEDKLRMHNKKAIRLSDAEQKLIIQDVPKLKSTIERRAQTISKLQSAIIAEQESMDREQQMIVFLEISHGNKN